MSDRRLTPFSGHVAHSSLRGAVDAERFTDGDRRRVRAALAPLLRAPGDAIERTLLLGRAFREIDRSSDGFWIYGFAEADGFCGWVHAKNLTDWRSPTHRVAVRESYCFGTPELKANEPATPLYFGSHLTVVDEKGDWMGFLWGESERPVWMPSMHVAPLATVEPDPVTVARRFLGSPYLWGGNSGRGIDCSGLVQAAMHACGRACPGDSDLQEQMPGRQLAENDALEPGDLLFWKGHVAMATGRDAMIHANAHHMMTVEEPIAPALARIAATDTGPVTSRLRPDAAPIPLL